jgi:DNA-binding response OmpR family regulator
MKILVVEDEPLMLKTISLKLTKEGYDVITAEDGKSAMDKIKSELPQLVITDIMMPYVSGLEIVSYIKNCDSKIPVIVLSAMGQEKTVLEAFNLGADDYMTKPFSPNELVIRVKRLTT